LSDGARRPTPEKFKKGTRGFLMRVGNEGAILLNLLIGSNRGEFPPLPRVLNPQPIVVWTSKLSAGYPVALVARIGGLEGANRDEVKLVREELRPRSKISGPYDPRAYAEARRYVWGEGGNVVLTVPMGEEAFEFSEPKERPAEAAPNPIA
jgi:hypothetical protein